MEALIVWGCIFLLVFLGYGKFGWYPKKPLGFRILHKSVGYVDYFKIQVKRPLFGWTGFCAFESSGEISTHGSWSNKRAQEEGYAWVYLKLKGIPKEKHEIGFKCVK